MKQLSFLFVLFTTALFGQTPQPANPVKITVADTSVKADTIVKADTLPKIVSPWKMKTLFGVNGSQTSFVNWSAGGRNNVSALGFVEASVKFKQKNMKWDNDLKFALGGLRYIDSTGKKDGLQKTDDKIDIATTLGYKFKKHWYYTLTGGFKTQSLDGFTFPNDSIPISTFMAPGYVSLSLGIEYAPKESFNFFFSPLSGKTTFVKDQNLANQGAFGVDKAILDTAGMILTPGKTIRNEFGSYIRLKFQKEVMKNIEMKSRLELFSNYLKKPENIDVNVETIFTFKVNKWFSASLQMNFQYDDDIKIKDRFGNTGPRVQFKSVLGLGISYTMTN